MIKKIRLLSLLLLGLNCSAYADSSAPNGTWLLGTCSGFISNSAPTPNNNYCAGFIQGVMLSWYTAEQQINPQGAAFWMNVFGSIPAFDSAKTIITYMGKNPGILHESAVSVIIAAINQNYPIPPASGS